MNRTALPPSRCNEILPHLEAYLDGEIADDSLIQCVQNHLEKCSSCQAEIDALKALHYQLQELPTLVAPKRLSERVGNLAQDWAGSQGNRYRPFLSRRIALILGVSVSLLAVAGLGIWVWSTQNKAGKRQPAERGDLIAFVDDYVAYVQSDSTPVVETRDPNRMEGWLAARLDFAPKLPRWSWAELITGRLCFIHGRRVARVQYQAGENDLTLFIQPLAEVGNPVDSEKHEANNVMVQTVRGFQIACWRTSGLDYVLVGPASSAQLLTKLEMEEQEY